MALSSSVAPQMSSAVAPYIAALACRTSAKIASRQIGGLATTRTYSCRAGRHPLFAEISLDYMKKLMDLKMDAHERHMGRRMKCYRQWIDQFQKGKLSDPRLNKDLLERFKMLLDLTMDVMEKKSTCASGSDLHRDRMDKAQKEDSARPNNDMTGGKPNQTRTLKSSDLNITVYKSGEVASVTRIPESALELAGKFAKACADFQGQDLRMDEVMRLMGESDIQGIVLEHERPKEDVRISISVGERSQQSPNADDQVVAPADLKVRTYKDAETFPDSITTISGRILCRAEKVIPTSASEAMRKYGVGLDEIVRFSTEPHAKGVVILDHEDLKKKERVVISLE